MSFGISELAKIIMDANSVILTTHKNPDGDGLGSEVALFHALKELGKKVKLLHFDSPPKRYSFLSTYEEIEVHNSKEEITDPWDLGLILDTNDKRLLDSLFEPLSAATKDLLFIDHHPVLEEGPKPSKKSLLDESAASTGEIVYKLLKTLQVPFNDEIAEGLYTSIAFDTQVFKYVRKSPTSHRIASELLEYNFDSESINRCLFGNYKKNKIYFMSDIIQRIEFFENDKYAFLSVSDKLLKEYKLTVDEVLDVVDFIAGINPVQIAIFHRANSDLTGKLSFRSNNKNSVRPLAESFGGGGHKFAAGAPIVGSAKEVKALLHEKVLELLD